MCGLRSRQRVGASATGQSAAGASVSHTYAAPGTYPVSLTSADTLANSTAATASIAIAPAPDPPAASARALTNVSQSHRVWREGSKQASLARRPSRTPPTGTSFAFTLNMRARVSLVFTQTATGRIVSGRCRAPSAQNRKRRPCHMTVTRGTLAFLAQPGAHRIAFQGRIATTRLPRGAYTLLIAAANTTTGQRSRTQTLHFTIVK